MFCFFVDFIFDEVDDDEFAIVIQNEELIIIDFEGLENPVFEILLKLINDNVCIRVNYQNLIRCEVLSPYSYELFIFCLLNLVK